MDYFLREDRNIQRYDYIGKKLYSAAIDGVPAPSFLIPIENSENRFLVGHRINRTFYEIEWNGKDSSATIVREIFDVETASKYATNFVNIGKASPSKHLFFGTNVGGICGDSGPVNASLYLYNELFGVKQLVKNVIASSGLAWNRKSNKLYYIDSCKYDIREFDWNPENDSICE